MTKQRLFAIVQYNKDGSHNDLMRIYNQTEEWVRKKACDLADLYGPVTLCEVVPISTVSTKVKKREEIWTND